MITIKLPTTRMNPDELESTFLDLVFSERYGLAEEILEQDNRLVPCTEELIE